MFAFRRPYVPDEPVCPAASGVDSADRTGAGLGSVLSDTGELCDVERTVWREGGAEQRSRPVFSHRTPVSDPGGGGYV